MFCRDLYECLILKNEQTLAIQVGTLILMGALVFRVERNKTSRKLKGWGGK